MTERVFADTNLFLCYFLNDVPAHADAVEKLLQRAGTGDITLVVNNVVISEIVWTLQSFYRLARPVIRKYVLAILNTPGLEVVEGDQVLQAINWYVDKNISYGDAQNAVWLISLGIGAVYTFDRKHFCRIEGVEVRVPDAVH